MTEITELRLKALQLAEGDIDKAKGYMAFIEGTEPTATPTPAKRKRKTAAEKKAEDAAKAEAEATAKAEAEAAAKAEEAALEGDGGDANPFAEDGGDAPTVALDELRTFAGTVMKAGVQRPDIVKAITDSGASKMEGLTAEQRADCMARLDALKAAAEGAGDL